MTNSLMLGGVYMLMAIMLVLGTLMSRREKPARMLVMMLAWISIFGGGFVIFTFRDDLGYVAQRLRSEATGAPVTGSLRSKSPPNGPRNAIAWKPTEASAISPPSR